MSALVLKMASDRDVATGSLFSSLDAQVAHTTALQKTCWQSCDNTDCLCANCCGTSGHAAIGYCLDCKFAHDSLQIVIANNVNRARKIK